ncbi:MAG TPA: sialidase family protein [Bryobacteraceae bacterium]|nr:sialidase family protein [Bryobacteraceae bacterium]
MLFAYQTSSRRSFLVSSLASAFVIRGDQPNKSPQDKLQWIKTPHEGLQPEAVIDSKGVVHVVYLYGDPSSADIAYMRKGPDEREFTSPIRVNSQPGSAVALGTVRGAHLAVGKSDRIHVAWNGSSAAEPKGPGSATPMLYTRLTGRGEGFEPQRNLLTTAVGLDGGGAVAADARGNVYVTWHSQGQPQGKPIEGEENRRVWLARSHDDGQTFETEEPVSPAGLGTCACCGMGAVADSEGNLYLLYRTAREIVHRDMYLLISRDRGRTFAATKVDSWEIGACPMSTASLVAGNGRVYLAWETDKQVYFRVLDSRNGALGKPVQPPGAANGRKHPALAVNERGEILMTWTEGTGWKKGGSLAWQLFDAAGNPAAANGTSPGLPPWDFAAIASQKNEFLVIS